MKIENLKRYWYFPISALAFLLINGRASALYLAGVMISFSIMIIFTACNKTFFENVHKSSLSLKIFSCITATGICLSNSGILYKRAINSPNIPQLINRLGINIPEICYYGGFILALLEFIFVYICVILFWRWFSKLIKESELFDDLGNGELTFYLLLILTVFCFTAFAFLRTNAFYIGIDKDKEFFDVIYTSDSPMNYCSFLNLAWGDFRHPLFAIFSAPFMGLPYFVAKIFAVSAPIEALLMNYVQIFMLFVATYIITKIMNLVLYKRILFFIISYCSYTYLLFTLMMEHYIVYVFWLVLLIYAICKKLKYTSDILLAAGGTILSSMILIIFVPEFSLFTNFKAWIKNIVHIVMKFFILLLTFGYFDMIFYNVFQQIIFMTVYTGKNLTFIDKFRQYTFFIHNCFFAPLTRIILEDTNLWANPSWQLQFFENVSYIGVIIFILCMISAFINWNKKSSRFAFLWVIFSFFVLGIVGWGTAENGLILYSLYFGWAFFVLMFQLVEKIEEKLNVKFLLPLYLAVNIYILFAINIPAMQKLIDFAIQYYPIAN